MRSLLIALFLPVFRQTCLCSISDENIVASTSLSATCDILSSLEPLRGISAVSESTPTRCYTRDYKITTNTVIQTFLALSPEDQATQNGRRFMAIFFNGFENPFDEIWNFLSNNFHNDNYPPLLGYIGEMRANATIVNLLRNTNYASIVPVKSFDDSNLRCRVVLKAGRSVTYTYHKMKFPIDPEFNGREETICIYVREDFLLWWRQEHPQSTWENGLYKEIIETKADDSKLIPVANPEISSELSKKEVIWETLNFLLRIKSFLLLNVINEEDLNVTLEQKFCSQDECNRVKFAMKIVNFLQDETGAYVRAMTEPISTNGLLQDFYENSPNLNMITSFEKYLTKIHRIFKDLNRHLPASNSIIPFKPINLDKCENEETICTNQTSNARDHFESRIIEALRVIQPPLPLVILVTCREQRFSNEVLLDDNKIYTLFHSDFIDAGIRKVLVYTLQTSPAIIVSSDPTREPNIIEHELSCEDDLILESENISDAKEVLQNVRPIQIPSKYTQSNVKIAEQNSRFVWWELATGASLFISGLTLLLICFFSMHKR